MRENEIIANGQYRVIRQLGHGGGGETYLVEDVQIKRQAALKVLTAGGPAAVANLQQEYALLARLDHPAFCRVYGMGVLRDDRLYLVTEFAPGRTLEDVLRDRELTVDDALTVARVLGDGLGYLHDQGFVHRDIKPSNVMVPLGLDATDEPHFAGVKLLDFGVVGQLHQEGSERLTMSGVIVGTPRYMSPEQIRGLPQSPATDVYGLGLLLFEMLFKCLPHEGSGDTAVAVMARIIQSDVELPSDARVPRHVRELVKACLNRDPARRPQSAYEFAELLDAAAVREMKRTTGQYAARRSVPVPLQAQPSRRERRSERAQLAAPKTFRRGTVIALGAVIATAVLVAVLLTLSADAPLPRDGVPTNTRPDSGLVRPPPGGAAKSAAAPALWIALGLVLGAGGLLLGNFVRRVARSRLHEVEVDAERLLLGLKTKRSLSETIQVEVQAIIARCREIDEKILGITILKMISEYDEATKSDQRQSALMNLATLLEKLRGRLSPWYARFEKQLAFATSTVGVVSGLVTITLGVMKIARGTP